MQIRFIWNTEPRRGFDEQLVAVGESQQAGDVWLAQAKALCDLRIVSPVSCAASADCERRQGTPVSRKASPVVVMEAYFWNRLYSGWVLPLVYGISSQRVP